MSAPKFLFLHLASECNLSCQHCLFWLSDTAKNPDRISSDRIAEIIAEFASISPSGKVVICGGEPMLEYARYMDVCQASRKRGLRVLIASNGTPINSPSRAQDLVLRGPHEYTISLDSADPDTHNWIRGSKKSHAAAVRAMQLLLQARRELATDTKVNAMVLLTSENYRDLRKLYAFVLHEIGADKLKINGLQPSFGVHPGSPPPDLYFARFSKLDVSFLREELLACNRLFDLHLNPRWIDQLCNYYADLGQIAEPERGWAGDPMTREHICECYDRNLVIGLYGEIGFCYSFHNFPPGRYENPGDLARYWEGNEDVREKMRTCNRLCSIGHSNRNVRATTP